MENYRSCPTHCCQVHGCKYGYKNCPVETKQIKGMTGQCETCGLTQEGYFGLESSMLLGVDLKINDLENENAELKKRIETLENLIS